VRTETSPPPFSPILYRTTSPLVRFVVVAEGNYGTIIKTTSDNIPLFRIAAGAVLPRRLRLFSQLRISRYPSGCIREMRNTAGSPRSRLCFELSFRIRYRAPPMRAGDLSAQHPQALSNYASNIDGPLAQRGQTKLNIWRSFDEDLQPTASSKPTSAPKLCSKRNTEAKDGQE